MTHWHRWFLSALLLGPVVTGAGCQKATPTTPAPPQATGPRNVYALGRLEPATGLISISAIPGQRLKELDPDVKEGELAPENGLLGVLATYDMRWAQLDAINTKLKLTLRRQQHERELTQAQVKQARAAEAQAAAKLREVQLQSAKLDNLREAAEIASEDYRRVAELSATDPEFVTNHQLRRQANLTDRAQQEYTVAKDTYPPAEHAAKMAYEAAKKQAELAVKNQELMEAIDQGETIDKEIQIARQALVQSLLLAPNIDPSELDDEQFNALEIKEGDPPGEYTVLKVFLQPGEFVTQTPIMQLADLRKMVCIAEVYEADAKEIREGQQVTIKSPAFDSQYASGIAGTVTSIGSLIAPPGLTNRNPLAPADRSVVEVRIDVDSAALEETARRVGLQVTVQFDGPPSNSMEQSLGATSIIDVAQ